MNNAKNIPSYDIAKTYLTLNLINKKTNSKLLEKMPHKEFLDMAVVVVLTYDLSEGFDTVIYINDELLQGWGETFDNVYKQAEKNLFSEETMFMNITEVLYNLGQDFDCGCELLPLYVLTNKKMRNGAAHMLNEKLIRDFSDKHNADVFVIPASIHEVLLFPVVKGFTEEEMTGMIQEVNTTKVRAQEVLSDHVYVYKKGFGWC